MTTAVALPTQRWHRPLLVLAAAMSVLALVAVVGVFVDDRELVGAAIWLKPFKFAVSLAVYSVTIAWMLSVLPRRSRFAERAATAFVTLAFVEIIIIVGQVVRGRRSHFNAETPLDTALFAVMAMSIMAMFVAHLIIAVVALRQRIPDRVAAYAIRLGLLLSAVGFLAAVPMTLPMQDPGIVGIAGAHAVGVADGGPGLPITGWSTTGGDLRIGHFVGMHGLQAMPLLALLLTRRTRLRTEQKTRLLVIGAIAYVGLTVLLTWQALRGQPLLRPDAVTLGALAVLVLGSALSIRAAVK
ncbi:hypothetical protein [Actinoplanes solisilvae]|uniref:hypothetical protein n=1 Tax=Actinoplanes solisilvae TaxID=2486853 RepID=UPI000FDABDAE|nr:hypothetical protein [Actinoplanes solisilvae]